MDVDAQNSPGPVGSPEWWDAYFAPGGGWEKNSGRQQTRIFAEAFCRRVALPHKQEFSFLDVGCGLGEALRVVAKRYPNARLNGVDISKVSVGRCREELGGLACVYVASIEEISTHYDVIYISNVLEHFTDFDVKARMLAANCSRLCILVPYDERRNGEPLKPDPEHHHQHTFQRTSFDFLLREKIADSIETHILSCPGAWGWSLRTKCIQWLKNAGRLLLGRPPLGEPRQIIYDVHVHNPRATIADGTALPLTGCSQG